VKSIKTILFALLLLALNAGNLYAKDIVILYSGSTHAMLYPCSCPFERDGGIARRASLVKELKRKHPALLLLDCGSFTAGGLLDEYTQNSRLDMQRSEVNLKAMELMGYDAVAVSSDEFNFGKDFFLKNAGKNNPVFLSANLESDKVLPYIVKQVSGVKIGIIGLTNSAAGQKAEGLKFKPPQAINELVKRLKNEGVGIVVVLSSLDKKENLELISKVKDIDILFVGYNAGKEGFENKAGSTFMASSSWQGRKLGKLTLKVKDGKLLDCKSEEIRLSDKIADDPEILSILPACYSDVNCKKEGLTGSCQNPGGPGASCLFIEPNQLRLIVIKAQDCVVCNTDLVIEQLKKQFPGLNPEFVDLKRAQGLIKDLSIEVLPAYIIGGEIEKEINFENFKKNLELRNGLYLLKPEASGISYFIRRQVKKGNLDLFFSLFDKDSAALLAVLREFNPVLHFLVVEKDKDFEAKGGRLEVEECLRGVCVQKYYPKEFWDYLACRAKNINSSWWEDCLIQADAQKIRNCARGEEGRSLLKENIALNKEVQVSLGLSYLLDNHQIFSTRGVPSKEELRKIIRK
jgi:5'-nucleotidase